MVPDMEFQIGYLLLLIDNILSQYEVKDWREDAICGTSSLSKWDIIEQELNNVKIWIWSYHLTLSMNSILKYIK